MNRVLLVPVLLVTLLLLTPARAAEPQGQREVLEGVVKYVTDLESPHYELRGVVLEARFDMKGLEGYYLRARGYWLDGPSIFMKRRFFMEDFDVLNKGEILELQGVIQEDLKFLGYRLKAEMDLGPYVGKEVYLSGKWDMELSTPEQKVLLVLKVEEVARRALPPDAKLLLGNLKQVDGSFYIENMPVYSELKLGSHQDYLVVARVKGTDKGYYVYEIQRLDADMSAPIGDPIYRVEHRVRFRLGKDYYPSLSTPLLLAEGRLLIDAYDAARAMYASITYDPNEHLVVLEGQKDRHKGMKYIWGTTRSSTMDGMIDLEVAPVLYNGRLMIPLRKTFEYFGYTVKWNARDWTVEID